MGANERNTFFRCLEEFQDERGEDSGPPLFAKKAVDTWKLWNAVQESGGFYEVTNAKGWARIGRLFDPPRTMTDLSFRIKKIYETHLLTFEKAIDDGRFPEVYVPPRTAPTQQPSVSRAGRTSNKRVSNSRATPTPSTRPKRARKETRHQGIDDSLVGKVIKIYFAGESRFTRGTVESYEKDMRMHRIKFEEGGSELLDLTEQEWMFDGPDNGLDIDRLNELRNEAYALDDEEAFGNESECEDLAPPKPRESLPKDCVEDRIHEDKGYKVYYTSDGRGYEIFCLVPALQLDCVRVKAWETGKILVRHIAQPHASAKGNMPQLTYRIRLPSGIVATETQAIITLHQQLYVRVPIFVAPDAKQGLPRLPGAVPPGESAVQAVTSETLEQEVKTPPDDEAAISPDRSNAISPEKAAPANTQNAEPSMPANQRPIASAVPTHPVPSAMNVGPLSGGSAVPTQGTTLNPLMAPSRLNPATHHLNPMQPHMAHFAPVAYPMAMQQPSVIGGSINGSAPLTQAAMHPMLNGSGAQGGGAPERQQNASGNDRPNVMHFTHT